MKKQFFRKPVVISRKCSCGNTLTQKDKTNYPFGKKSKGVKVKYFKCSECGNKFN